MPAGGAQLAHDPQRSPATLPSVGMLRHVRLRAIRIEFRVENFENLSRPRNFAFELARDRAEMHAGRWCADCLRPLEVPSNSAEHRHAPTHDIARSSNRISGRNFRILNFDGREILRPESRQNRCRLVKRSSLRTLRGPQQLCRASACSIT